MPDGFICVWFVVVGGMRKRKRRGEGKGLRGCGREGFSIFSQATIIFPDREGKRQRADTEVDTAPVEEP